MPAVAVASAAPAIAASPVPGLQGKVYWMEDCANGVVRITPDDSGNGSHLYPNGDYGFYVFNTKASQVSSACMTFTYPSSLGKLAWKAASGNGAWSLPTVVGSGGGLYTYQSCYTGAFVDHTYTDRANNSTFYTAVSSYPNFTASIGNACPNPLDINITRSVTVSGKVITFNRTVEITPSV